MSCTLCNLVYGIVGVVVFTLILGWWMNGYFRRRGVKSPTAYLPFIGNMLPALRRTIHLKDFVHQIYKDYPNEKYVGFHQFHKPILVLRDVELIKKVTVKDFDHFVDRGAGIDESSDPIFGNTLINLNGQKWRDMRATLSPAFTSSKIRGMFRFVVECGEQMANYYMKEMDTSKNKVRGLLELEMKDVFTRYANDVIATSAFGLSVNSFNEKDNEFYLMGQDVTDTSGIRSFKLFSLVIIPRIAKMLDITFISKKCANFFRGLVWGTVKEREEHNIVRHDMIQLLMEARKGTLKHDTHDDGKEAGFATVEESSVGKESVKRVWTDDEIVAQAVLFFIAGFDTSSTLLCFLAHELALRPEIQKRLQEEIDEVAESIDGKLTCDCLQKMKYMDMVVSETLRMWPPSAMIDRKCIKPYTFPPPNDTSSTEYYMNTGDVLSVPIYGLHHDPKYFNNPEVFDPERFSDENKHNIQHGTYIPFGIGPRNCIGSRFALMEAKAVIYNLLLKFDIVTTAKTQHPIKLKLDTFNMQAERGFWVGLKPRFKRLLSNQI